ncbi:MAG: deaminase [Methanogenium sp.]|jgi:dCMP deaminase
MSDRITKEEMFMKIAEIVSMRSTCKRLNVGAVITDSSMLYILSIGYNGNYAGGPNTCDTDEPGACGCIHAEINALVKADNRIKDKILFTTNMPCKNCAKLIINSGFSKVFYRHEYRLPDGVDLLKQSNIEVHKI